MYMYIPSDLSGPLINQSAELDNKPCCKNTGIPVPRRLLSQPFLPHGILCNVNKYPSSVSTVCASAE